MRQNSDTDTNPYVKIEILSFVSSTTLYYTCKYWSTGRAAKNWLARTILFFQKKGPTVP